MQTGENEQALRKIIDFTRFLGILILILHFYFSCYGAFSELHLSYPIVNRILVNIYKLSIFKSMLIAKSVAIIFLIVSLIGTKGKKDEKINLSTGVTYSLLGLVLYYTSGILFKLKVSYLLTASLYISVTTIGFLFFLTGVSMMYRIINVNLNKDIFNDENETFPQEERKLENEYSINLPAKYYLKKRYGIAGSISSILFVVHWSWVLPEPVSRILSFGTSLRSILKKGSPCSFTILNMMT